VLFTRQGLTWRREVELPADVRKAVDPGLRPYEAVQEELQRLEDHLMAMARRDAQARLLMTLPGAAHGVALSLLAAPGDVTRFKDGDHAASYRGRCRPPGSRAAGAITAGSRRRGARRRGRC